MTLPRAMLDRDQLRDLRGTLGDPAVASLIDMMLRDIPTRVATVIAALAASESGLAAREAHALRGAASGIGARRLADACRAIEHADCPVAGRALRKIARSSCAALRRLRNQLTTSSD